ncbi:hypothetical protein AAC387_Pa12g1843 [Persea americana]
MDPNVSPNPPTQDFSESEHQPDPEFQFDSSSLSPDDGFNSEGDAKIQQDHCCKFPPSAVPSCPRFQA